MHKDNQTSKRSSDEVIDNIIKLVLELDHCSMTGLQWKLQHKLAYYLNKYKADSKQLTIKKDE